MQGMASGYTATAHRVGTPTDRTSSETLKRHYNRFRLFGAKPQNDQGRERNHEKPVRDSDERLHDGVGRLMHHTRRGSYRKSYVPYTNPN